MFSIGNRWQEIHERARVERIAALTSLAHLLPARARKSKTPAPHKSTPTRDQRSELQVITAIQAATTAATTPNTSKFAHLARLPSVADCDDDLPQQKAKQILDAAALARQGGSKPAKPTGLAKQIVDAAALAREGGYRSPEPSGLAKRILNAGKKRRGEI